MDIELAKDNAKIPHSLIQEIASFFLSFMITPNKNTIKQIPIH